MKKLIQRLALGTALLATGAGIATPIAFNAGNKQGYDAGRQSARPVKINVRRVINPAYNFGYLEGVCTTDSTNNGTSLYQYEESKIEPVNQNYSNEGTLITTTYFTENPNRR